MLIRVGCVAMSLSPYGSYGWSYWIHILRWTFLSTGFLVFTGKEDMRIQIGGTFIFNYFLNVFCVGYGKTLCFFFSYYKWTMVNGCLKHMVRVLNTWPFFGSGTLDPCVAFIALGFWWIMTMSYCILFGRRQKLKVNGWCLGRKLLGN